MPTLFPCVATPAARTEPQCLPTETTKSKVRPVPRMDELRFVEGCMSENRGGLYEDCDRSIEVKRDERSDLSNFQGKKQDLI